MKTVLCLAFAAAMLLAGGCGTAPKIPPPRSSSTLVLGPADRQVLRSVPLGGELRLILPAPLAGAPYAWEIVSNNVRVLAETKLLAPLPAATPAQAFAATFQAINPGRSILRLAAIRKGASESEPDDLYEVVVSVKAAE